MIPKRAFRIVLWAIFLTPLTLQGCTKVGSNGWSSAAVGETPVSVAGLGPETLSITSDEMAPFLGNWQGSWEEDYSTKSFSTTSDTRRALLVVKVVSGNPIVTWALGAGNGGGTWHDANTHYSPSIGRYPAKFSKKDGMVSMVFTTRLGNNYRFVMKGDQLYGVNTSAGFSVRCDLMRSSREELFTDASLAQFYVGLN
jgi:hypothetical protein